MKTKSATESAERYARNSAKAFLDGGHNLIWITKVLEHSGLTGDRAREILRPLTKYGNPALAKELFTWLAIAN